MRIESTIKLIGQGYFINPTWKPEVCICINIIFQLQIKRKSIGLPHSMAASRHTSD